MTHFVNFGLLFSFFTLAITGLLSFVLPFSINVARIHIIFGFLTFILIGVHLYWRLKYFKKQFRVNKKAVYVSAVVWLILMGATFENWWPVKKVIEQGYESKHRHEIVRAHPLVASIQEKNRHTTSRQKEGSGKTALSINVALNNSDKPFPAMAIWAESKNNTIIETLFLSEDIAYSDKPDWHGKETPRNEIMPIWRHRYTAITGVSPNGKVDASSGATQSHQFSLDSHLAADGEPFTIFLEINAPADADSNWPDKHLGQPSILYSVYIEPENKQKYYLVELTGHGGEAFKDGNINYDASTLTSAKEILDLVLISIDY
jgi:hypothetical protein